MPIPDISIIISTYNQPEWLKKVLWSYNYQTYKNFELIIADDGSSIETKNCIDEFVKRTKLIVKHVWHKDDGFQKTIILNKALLESSSNYVLFTDGDCIARNDFVKNHIDKRRPNCFLSGGYFKLPMNISKKISRENIKTQHCFDINWLKTYGLKSSFKNNKITARGIKETILNTLTPTKATWNGHNSSGWKDDIIAVNGFDERMQYGGEDRELGERLINFGIKPLQIRYSAICLHLDHSRSYVNPTMIKKNNTIRKKTKSEKIIKTPYGIEKIKL